MRKNPSHELQDGYRIRMLLSLAAILLAMIALVRLWPLSSGPTPDPSRLSFGQEAIRIEEIRPTRQRDELRPPPPAPLPPVVVPHDVILDPSELDLTDAYLSVEPGPMSEAGEAASNGASLAEGPRPVRFVEPEYTREAQRRRIRAEVVVSVSVDAQGRVEGVRVLERYLLGREDAPRESVSSLGYGLEEAATAAAERWLFRPARRNGEPVQSETTITFRFGV